MLKKTTIPDLMFIQQWNSIYCETIIVQINLLVAVELNVLLRNFVVQ